MIEIATNAIKSPWRRFWHWVDVKTAEATIGGLQDDLRILEGIQGHHEASKKLILEEIEAEKQRLYLLTRKGGV